MRESGNKPRLSTLQVASPHHPTPSLGWGAVGFIPSPAVLDQECLFVHIDKQVGGKGERGLHRSTHRHATVFPLHQEWRKRGTWVWQSPISRVPCRWAHRMLRDTGCEGWGPKTLKTPKTQKTPRKWTCFLGPTWQIGAIGQRVLHRLNSEWQLRECLRAAHAVFIQGAGGGDGGMGGWGHLWM